MLSLIRKKICALGADSALIFHSNRFFETQRPVSHEIYTLCGFTGSYAKLWVSQNSMCLFTDDRYLIQAEKECKNRTSVHNLSSLHDYIQTHSKILVIDLWQISKKHAEKFSAESLPCKVVFEQLLAFPSNFQQTVFPLPFLGRSPQLWKSWFKHPVLICNSQDLSFLCRVATENIFLPTLQGYGLGWWEEACNEVLWLVGVDSPVIKKKSFPSSVTILPMEVWKSTVKKTFSKIYYIPETTPLGLLRWFPQTHKISSWDLPKTRCIKTNEELEATRQAHIFEGVAFTRFLYWLETQKIERTYTEYSAALQLEEFRKKSASYQGPSFPTISASGPSGAMIHYVPKPHDQTYIQNGPYLIDAGGQYHWGTTDMTRSMWLGPNSPDSLYQEDYTQVLQAHIDVAMAIFPKGTFGSVLDTLARNVLWKAHKDYGHSTGHGVGVFSNVHEGPIQLSSGSKIVLEPNMICSNEPGYYRQGLWGIRLENLFHVKEDHPGWLKWNVLSLAPFQRRLIQKNILGQERIAWLNAYHEQVFTTLCPYLSKKESAWLQIETFPH
ncbi:M24 family metallopeptidase [Holospora undulata]|uniref:Putative Xaa-Pro aminopeptidase P n=3 Tax=Holospora TaxID=44747 RepID=A0A061JHZ4_9PROT|nr:M24 family metallopeptidase [Holospora undulata]ETZ05073.1 putative Xaa-Pro aminopeptidase P [Holospora undulata HU1]GAJ46702.1 putative Xaa-Pro aminopeptidase P [Holospora elegans E1]